VGLEIKGRPSASSQSRCSLLALLAQTWGTNSRRLVRREKCRWGVPGGRSAGMPHASSRRAKALRLEGDSESPGPVLICRQPAP
jgi:hypothetical protein